MNTIKKLFKNLNISTQMSIFFILITSLVGIAFYFVLPNLLNYPPNTINTEFDKNVSGIYYIYQYAIAICAILFIFTLYFKFSLRKIDSWNKNKSKNIKVIADIRKKCFAFPYKLYLILEIFPVSIVTLVLLFTRESLLYTSF